MTNIYRDTDERYQRDPEFYSAVRTMEAIAREHGFTPGELKQIAFKAALNLEERRDGQVYSVINVCAGCGAPVTRVGSWVLWGKNYCGNSCWSAAGGRP